MSDYTRSVDQQPAAVIAWVHEQVAGQSPFVADAGHGMMVDNRVGFANAISQALRLPAGQVLAKFGRAVTVELGMNSAWFGVTFRR